MADDSLFRRFWEFLGHIGNLQTLFGLFASFGVSSTVIGMLPGGWHSPQYWALFGTAFFGTAFLIAVTDRGVRRALRWFAETRVELTADSGEHGCVGIRVHGGPISISAHGRILQMLNGQFNPSPHRFDCRLSKGGQAELSRTFGDGDWAQIILGSEHREDYGPGEDQYEHRGLSIHRGGTVVRVPDAGAVVEIEFAFRPPLSKSEGTRVGRFSVRWHDGHVQVEEVAASPESNEAHASDRGRR